MTWEKKDVAASLPADFAALVTASEQFQTTLQTSTAALEAAFTAIKTFIQGSSDPFSSIVDQLITDTENLIDDTFNAGIYQLVVTPYTVANPTYDESFGLPTLTPGSALNLMSSSFDDEGDASRPQFSDSANVSGFGLMATAASPDELITAIQGLKSLINLNEFDFTLRKMQKTTQTAPARSTRPDWQSRRVQDIPPFGSLYTALQGYLEQFRGWKTTGDDLVGDFLDGLQRKIDAITNSLDALSNAIDTITSAVGVSGVYWLDIPSTTGGNTYLKDSLPDSALAALSENKYTAAVLYVAGGPSTQSLETFKTVFK